MTSFASTAPSPLSAARATRLAVLGVGPLLSWAALQRWLTVDGFADEAALGALVLAVLWSPVFFGIPALLLQNERDALLPARGGPIASLIRGARLVPALLRSRARTETVASLVGWAALVAVAAPALTRAFSLLW